MEEKSREPVSIAYYCTGHGYGHATRSIEVCRVLLEMGHSVTVITGAPAGIFIRELPSACLAVRKAALDFGAKQKDAFSVDMAASLEGYRAIAGGAHRATLLETEQAWLTAVKPDLVVSDIVPLACAAAAAVGIPCVCISNFSWDFVYSEYLISGQAGCNGYRSMIYQIAEDYACADLILRLPGHAPMPAFREVEDVPLVVRHARKSRQQVYRDYGLPEERHMVVFIYGGQPPGEWRLRQQCLPPGWTCIVCAAGSPPGGAPLPPNFILAPADAYTPDLIAASDALIGKIGYGTVSECLAHGKPLVFVRRDYFNEEPFLRRLLQIHNAAVEIRRRDFMEGSWAPFLTAAAELTVTFSAPTSGADVVAKRLQRIARTHSIDTLSPSSSQQQLAGTPRARAERAGSVRLRDAIVWGYMMQRPHARTKVEVPEWYTAGFLPPDKMTSSFERDMAGLHLARSSMSEHNEPDQAPVPPRLEHWEVLSGGQSLSECRDTVDFLYDLMRLDEVATSDSDSPSKPTHELPERRAARGLFRWEDPVLVARAPGRLDVMGGIADYSGSLVLQLPLAEACHIAVQRQPLPLQRVWRHMQVRHEAAGGPKPALRIVSLHADLTNRGPTFDMDLSELERDGQPISYAEAEQYFKRDPAHSWAAYVAGALVVLMREQGLHFSNGLSILVSSAVPEGKGVSSSAAVEVATMQALAAAHGLQLDGRQLALLCQKVENCVVGAPCGAMDQLTSALGQAGSLLALRCQPAEMLDPVALPPSIRLWGIDSGIRHSVRGLKHSMVRAGAIMGLRMLSNLEDSFVGGLDYGTVRAGAFMGLQMLSNLEDSLSRQSSYSPMAAKIGHSALENGNAHHAIGNGYLANVSPSDFAAMYEEELPVSLSGKEWLATHEEHWDSATQVDPGTTYLIRQPTAHPILENWRVELFRQLLSLPNLGLEQLKLLGEIMYQSHASYGRCGLGSDGTDRIVALVHDESAAAAAQGDPCPLYGAKITGGGSGGTVCVLGANSAAGEAAVQRVVERYGQSTGGYTATVFSGASPGAMTFGVLTVKRKGGCRPSSAA